MTPRQSRFAITAFGLALLAAPLTPAVGQSGRESGYGAVGSWYGQNRLAERMEGATDWQDAPSLLQQADGALGRGNTMLANELLERAETRLLSRSIDANRIGAPAVGGVAADIAEARQAVVRGDRTAARQRIQTAMEAMRRGTSATGEMDYGPMQGGSTVVVPGGSGGTTVIVR